MKKSIILFSLLILAIFTNAQLKARTPCAGFVIDWLGGKINGAAPDNTVGQIKEKLPCFSSIEEESATTKCGGKIEYKEADIRYFTKRDYVEVGEKFKGKQTVPLLGNKKANMFKILGHPKMKDPEWEAFQTAYGCIILYYNKAGIVKKVRFSTNGTETIQLCE